MQIEIEFTPEGKVVIPWWTPEIAELTCLLCGHNGWQKYGPIKPTELLDESLKKELGPCYMCQTRHPWCG